MQNDWTFELDINRGIIDIGRTKAKILTWNTMPLFIIYSAYYNSWFCVDYKTAQYGKSPRVV